MKADKRQVMSGFAWKFAERISSQGVSFVISVVLARILLPEDYGLVAMINVFMVFASVFVTSGFTASLIQKKDADDLDFSTILYCTIFLSLLLYAIIFICSPAIASFYNMPDLCLLTRVYALSLIITSYQSIQQAYISRHLLFKKTFTATLVGSLVSGIFGVILAYLGFGVWALVSQSLLANIFNMLTLILIIPWRPKLLFSWQRARTLMGFGSNILLSTLISTIYKEIRQLIIGKMYEPADLGFYNRGMSLPNMISDNVDTSIRSVLFPTMSNYSDNPQEIKRILRRGIKTSSYITFFFFTLLATSSKPLIILLLTEKWLPCVPYMQIFCISNMFLIISRYNIQAIKALGRGKEVVKLEVLKKPIFLLVILAAAKYGVFAIALTSPFNSLYAMAMNMKPTRKLLNYKYKEQLHDMIPATSMAFLIVIVTIPFSFLNINPLLIMSLQITAGLITFIGISKLFKSDSYIYIANIIKGAVRKR